MRYTGNFFGITRSIPFELIVVDNGSTDGSPEFFESRGACVIRNGANYSYPHCQNQGIAAARYDRLAFLNNDVIVSPRWDAVLTESMLAGGLDVATACGIEQVEDARATRRLKRRWKRIGCLSGLLGRSKAGLLWMHRWMYGDWRAFCRERQTRFRGLIKEGFCGGNTVMMHRRALEKIGPWGRISAGGRLRPLSAQQSARAGCGRHPGGPYRAGCLCASLYPFDLERKTSPFCRP